MCPGEIEKLNESLVCLELEELEQRLEVSPLLLTGDGVMEQDPCTCPCSCPQEWLERVGDALDWFWEKLINPTDPVIPVDPLNPFDPSDPLR